MDGGREEHYQKRSGSSVVKQVKSKAADKWRRAHLERGPGEGCDRHKKRTQTWMRPTQEGIWRKSEEEWEAKTSVRKSGGTSQ